MTPSRPLMIGGLVALFIAWIIGFLVFYDPFDKTEADEMEVLTRSEAFQKSILGQVSEACVALPYQGADVIVVGSSHAYAAIDTVAMNDAMAGKVAGLCAHSTWNVEFFEPFLDYMDQHEIRSERLVWIVDDAAFGRLPLHEARLEYAQSVFSQGAVWQQIIDRWNEAAPFTLEDHDRIAERAAEEFSRLEPAIIEQRLLENLDIFTASKSDIMRSLEPVPRMESLVDQLCDEVSERDITLDLVISPVPEGLDGKLFQPLAVREDLARQSVPCAGTVVARSATEWGLDIRDHVNRRLLEDYDYAAWSSGPDDFTDYLNSLPDRDLAFFFDADHINQRAATTFSRALVEALDLDE